jgi:hypothetical protein
MLTDLSPDQRRLADYMSELSELAYCAGWMDGLEFALWEVVQGARKEYGQTVFTEAQRQELRALSERIGGWVVFDDQHEESFLPLEDWKHAFAKRNGEQA